MIDFTLYRHFRDRLHCPAHLALRWGREQERLACWIATVGFRWHMDRSGNLFARWSQDGFELQAVVATDPEDWWPLGIETYGEFSMRWAPGAVRHSDGRGHEYAWFIPADPDRARQAYTRACDYGSGWEYVHFIVTAWRAGVELASASLSGIESDAGEDYFTEVACELASEAVAEAVATMGRLCQAA
jgi:hypothetical protein